ncbi:MAG: alginate export family protein [Verrucomicrobiota bacterium]|jgi:hypothetical protein
MTTKAQALTIIMLGATLAIAPAQTNQTTAAAPATVAPALSSTEQMIQDMKNPFPWLSWGADMRIRNEYFNNAFSLTADQNFPPGGPGTSPFAAVHSQDYFRFRGRLWTSITPVDGLSLNARLAAEPRDFMEKAFSDTYFEQSGMQWRYGIIDNLNVQWKEPVDLPVTLTVGRQDIFLGDGWLVGDGTPEDGSFTYFLDSARATWELKDCHTTIDAIGIVQYARPDAWLPTLGPSSTVADTQANPGPPYGHIEPFLLTDSNEKGAILWIANKSLPAANVDAFFLYKHDSAINDFPASLFTDNADIYTFGGRLSGALADHWKYSAEGAYQFGQKQDLELNSALAVLRPNDPSVQTTGFRNLSAFGANSKLSYLFKDSWNDQLSLSFEFLSGDNPNTKTDEMFDSLWGRWPQWSEMNTYSDIQETRVGQTANLYRVGPTWSVTPVKDLDFSASYYALFANQAVPTRDLDASYQIPAGLQSQGPFSTTGTFRGHYLQSVLKYKFSRHLSGHLWGELMFPGDFYVDRGMVTFLRAELMFSL